MQTYWESLETRLPPRILHTKNFDTIVMLFRSVDHLSLLLSSMKQCLPQDISLQLLKGASWLRSLQGCLTSILEEANGVREGIEHKMRGEPDGNLLQEEDKKLAGLMDKTDWTMSMAMQ